MSSFPIVTIVVPTRNRAHLLHRALAGIAAQSFTEYECLVVDDGSTAESRKDCAAIVSEFDDRFRFLPFSMPGVPPTGPSCTRNRGIREGVGEFVAFCDDDDEWIARDHLATAVHVLRESADRTLFFSNMEGRRGGKVTIADWYPGQSGLRAGPLVFDEPAVHEVARTTLSGMLRQVCPHLNTCVIRRDALVQAGLFWERTGYGEDWNVIMRVVDVGQRYFHRPDVTVAFTASSRGSAFNDTPEVERSLLMILNAHHVRHSCRDSALRACARAAESWHLRQLARFQAAAGQHSAALSLVMQALWVFPTPSVAVSALHHGWHAMFVKPGHGRHAQH
jgi:glycosyltransferase involved in cell wall biosynthesis